MKTLKSYNELNEGLFFNKWHKLQTSVTKELGLYLYFITTFGTSVTVFYPLFESLIKNTDMPKMSDSDIVLLTICSLSILLKENKTEIGKMLNVIKEKNLKEILDSFTKILSNITNLFSNIAVQFGKSIKGLMEMITYTSLLVPFMIGVSDIINLYKIDFNSFDQVLTNPKGALLSTVVGVLTVSLKHIISMLVKKISRNIKSKKTPENSNDVVQQFESVDVLFENYFTTDSSV